jgi:hypothetical protein
MSEGKVSVNLGSLPFLIVAAILGYFVYGGIDGALAMIVFTLAIGVVSLISLIPLVGFIIYALLVYMWVFPWIMPILHIYPTWLTSGIFGIYVVATFVVSLMSAGVFIKWLSS